MLTVTATQLNAWVAALLWPFMRIGAMLLAAPVFGARFVPVRVRIALALVLSLALAPLVGQGAGAIDPLSAQGLLVSVQQVLIGLVMGFTVQMVFASVLIGAQSIAMSMGLGFATAVDPQNGVQVPVLGQYYLTLTTLIFLALNGHLLLMQLMVDSFHTLPIGAAGIGTNGLWTLVGWGARMFSGAVLIALTAVTALLLINLTFGVMSRAAPQLNIFGVGFPVMLGAGFVILLFSLPGISRQLAALVQDAFHMLDVVLAGG
jgi:flagellar biosynthetic protein FliR